MLDIFTFPAFADFNVWSNLAFLVPAYYAWRHREYIAGAAITFAAVFSVFYHCARVSAGQGCDITCTLNLLDHIFAGIGVVYILLFIYIHRRHLPWICYLITLAAIITFYEVGSNGDQYEVLHPWWHIAIFTFITEVVTRRHKRPYGVHKGDYLLYLIRRWWQGRARC